MQEKKAEADEKTEQAHRQCRIRLDEGQFEENGCTSECPPTEDMLSPNELKKKERDDDEDESREKQASQKN